MNTAFFFTSPTFTLLTDHPLIQSVDMPAPVALSPTAHTSNKANGSKTRAPPRPKKTRIVRRRGRVQGGIESDDEIEREVGTDSDSDNDDDQSSVDSASDSDTEPASEDVLPNGHARVLTPSLTRNSGDVVPVTQASSKSGISVNGEPGAFFGGAAGNWSEMVTDENANGPADLPVIDFADFGGRSDKRQTRKSQKGSKRPPVVRKVSSPVSVPSEPASSKHEHDDASDDDGGEEPVASTSRPPPRLFPTRAPGQTARQAYQQRLDKDPSYVPTVGEFWGHDDRLLDKDLRSLSGWWRGRWQGRGRGRGGFDRGFRGRGRGGFFGPPPNGRFPNQDITEETMEADGEIPVPPVDRAWTHDGFEEMRLKEETRRSAPQQPFRGAAGLRGGRGGAFIPGARGRGGFAAARGGFMPSPARSNNSLPSATTTGRTWFAMKPERVWTKQHDGFLHLDQALKPRPGQGQGIQVKLPGATGHVVRLPPGSVGTSKASSSSIVGADDGEKYFVVRIPKRAGKEKEREQVSMAVESFTTVEEPPLEDDFTVRQRHVTRPSIPDSQTTAAVPPVPPIFQPSQSIETRILTPPQSAPAHIAHHQEVIPDDQGWIQPDTMLLQTSETRVDNQEVSPLSDNRLPPPVLPPIQTSFTPPQTTPPYGSPYGYPPGLPPGVAMNQQGMPYELATGRAIYYQPPPPQQVYNPRPIMHTHMAPPPGIPFVPGHMRHVSTASPDFVAPPHTPPVNGFIDPATGTPIFSMPRQSSRVEIRAPEQLDSKYLQKTVHRPSGLRTTATAFEPGRSAGDNGQDQSYFPDVVGSHNGSYPNGSVGEDPAQHGMDPNMMGYPPYQQEYYYPQEHYGYPQYGDVSQQPQYMYPQEAHAVPQQAVYY